MRHLDSGPSLNGLSASQTQGDFPKKDLSFSGFLSNSFQVQQTLSNPPQICGVDWWHPICSAEGSVFHLLPDLQAGAFPESSLPLKTEMASGWLGYQGCEFSLLCPSLQGPQILSVGSAWGHVPRGHYSTPNQGSASLLLGYSPAFSPASRRTPQTERHKGGGEREVGHQQGGLLRKPPHRLSGSLAQGFPRDKIHLNQEKR